MPNTPLDFKYTEADINNAFNLGLENAVYILEKSIHLSKAAQRQMIDCLKKMIEEGKTLYIKQKMFSDNNSK